VDGRSICVSPCASWATFDWRSISSFPGIPECAGTQWLSVLGPWARGACALRLIQLASRCSGPGSRCAVHRMATSDLLKPATIFTLDHWSVSLFLIITSSTSPIAHSSVSKTSIHPVLRYLRRYLHSSLCLPPAAAPTRPSPECNLSVHHIQSTVSTLASVFLAQSFAALFAAVVLSSMTVRTTDSAPGAVQLMPSVVRPCSCSFFTALHTGVLEEWFWCSFLRLLLHVFASLAAIRCSLDTMITGVGVCPQCLINAPRGVVSRTPRIDLACRGRRSWRSSCLPASLGSHQSSLPYNATAWTHATWTALTVSGTTQYFFVRVCSLASATLAFFMHRL